MLIVSLSRVYSISLRQFYSFRQKPFRLLSLVYSPAFEFAMWFFITKYFYEIGGKQSGLIEVLLGAVILWGFFSRIQQNICVQFLEDIRSRNLLNLFVSPLSISEYLAGFIVISFMTSGLSLLGIAFTAAIFHLYNIATVGLWLLAYLAVLFLFGWSVGIFTTAMILRFGRTGEALLGSIPSILAALSAVFYSVDTLPTFLRPLCSVIPSSYIFEGMRQIAAFGRADLAEWLIAFSLSLFYFGLSIVFFYRTHQSVVKSGLLTRLMTE